MKLRDMREKVKSELEFIPGWPKPMQGELRMVYFAARMHSLGKKATEEKTATDVLHDCIASLRERFDCEFQYDKKFFC